MKKLLLLLWAVLFCLVLKGQEFPNIVPPSPEATSLAKFTEVPVSYYTGLPTISIPIYTIEEKGITIPINLSYHARGIQVSEMASRTGLGWSLIYGGTISRQVRGKADESPIGGYFANKNNFINYPVSEDTRRAVLVQEAANPSYDYFPDQFTFTAGQNSGKFIFDYNDLKPIIQNYDDIKILSYSLNEGNLPSVRGITSFILQDSKGNKYYYGKSKDGSRHAREYEQTHGRNVYLNGSVIEDSNTVGSELFYNSWKLMDIETTYGKMISYHYELEETNYFRKAYDTSDLGNHENPSTTNTGTNIYSRVLRVSSVQYQLQRITFSKGSLVFSKSSNPREDYGGYTLKDITLYDNQSKLIKKFNFTYYYTTNSQHRNVLWYLRHEEKAYKRLFLKNIYEEDNSGKQLAYTFSYNTTNLPNIFSTSQDFWGYYNGANNGPFLLFWDYSNYKVDRRVNIENSEAGMLKEIKFPSGGITRFFYEHNRGIPPDYFQNIITTTDINPDERVELRLTKSDFTYNSNTGFYEVNSPISFPRAKITYQANCMHLRDINDTTTPDCIFSFYMDGQSSGGPTQIPINQRNELTPCYLGSGDTYTFTVRPQNITNVEGIPLHTLNQYDFEIKITYDLPNEKHLLFASGKRINKIEYEDETGIVTKSYEYKIPETNNTSGNIIGIPSYFDGVNNTGIELLNPCWNFLGKFHGPASPYSTFQPNTVSYSHVTEYSGLKENNIGKTEFSYTFIPDSGGDYYNYPYHPPTDNEWLRGRLLSTKAYSSDANATTFKLKKEVANKYLYADNVMNIVGSGGLISPNFTFTPRSRSLIIEDSLPSEDRYFKNRTSFKLPLYITRILNRGNLDPNNINFYYRFYHFTGGSVDLWKTKETVYADDNELTSETEYLYDYNNHYQLKGKKVSTSKEDLLETTFYYPTDVSNLAELSDSDRTAINILKNQHRFDVVQTEIYKNNVLQSTQRTNYKDWGEGLVLPKEIQTLKGAATANNRLEPRLIYHSYDNKGNPLELSKADGTRVVYIWGYQDTQPVAKLESVRFNEIPTALYNAVVATSNADNDRTIGNLGKEGELREALQSLRDALPSAMVTSYTYDPLIGVTSITDARGATVYYEYDDFNRLVRVKDQEGNVVTEHAYNYKNNN